MLIVMKTYKYLRYSFAAFFITLCLGALLYAFIQPQPKPVLLQNLASDAFKWQFAASVQRPAVESALWQDVDIGEDLSSQHLLWGGSDNILAGKYTGWYRLVFNLNTNTQIMTDQQQPLAFLFGKVQESDQVWLNGHYLGRYGIVDNHEYQNVADLYQQRLYAIPHHLLRPQNNVLYMQTQAARSNGGIVSQQIGISRLSDALHYKQQIEQPTRLLQTISLTLLAVSCFVALILYLLTDLQGREHPLFIVLFALIFIGYLYDSLLFNASTWKTPLLYQLSYVLGSGLFIVLILYVLALANYPVTLFHQILMVCFAIYSGFQFIPLWEYTWVTSLLGTISLPFILLFSLYKPMQSSLQKGERHLIAILIGLLLWFISFLVSYLFGLWFDVQQYTIQFHEMGLLMVILGLMISYVQRLIQLQFRFQALSLKLFDISEKERQHVARELHDGISQRLAALRLHLQLLSEQHPTIGLEKNSDELLAVMEEMGRVLHGLHPLDLDEYGLILAMQHEIDRVAESSDIPIIFDADKVNIAEEKEQHLFRIFQECLSNAVRHAQAGVIHVSLKTKGRQLSLSIEDDGKGWQQKPISGRKWNGLGKLTLQERIEMINARLSINIKENQGTLVRIDVKTV
jgi:signal transduction histidine kinase